MYQLKRSPAIDPLPKSSVLTILEYCHRNVAKCYGCGGEFYINVYPPEPQDVAVASKMKRMSVPLETKEVKVSPEITKVYCHFNVSCIIKTCTSFATGLPNHLRSQLSPFYKAYFFSAVCCTIWYDNYLVCHRENSWYLIFFLTYRTFVSYSHNKYQRKDYDLHVKIWKREDWISWYSLKGLQISWLSECKYVNIIKPTKRSLKNKNNVKLHLK